MNRLDFENANCKKHISEICKDFSQTDNMTIEKPLKCASEIRSLDHLLEELRLAFSSEYVNVEYVSQLMWNYKSDPREWKKYAKFDRYRYTRNLVDEGNGCYNVMVLCWGPGHASSIHDHADSHCFMKMLSGELSENRYAWPKTEAENNNVLSETINTCEHDCEHSKLERIGVSKLELNDVCYINDTLGLHRVENPSDVNTAVSLHLYCPPFDSCRIFDAQTGAANKTKVTFTSKYGKRIIISDAKITEID